MIFRPVAVALFAFLPLYANAASGSDIRTWNVVQRDGDWELRKGTDGFDDAARCVVTNASAPEVQASKARLFIGVEGGIENYRLRFDDTPPTETLFANKIEQRIDTAILEGQRFDLASKGTRLRIQASTRYRGTFQGDYSLQGLGSVLANWDTNGCPDD